MAKTKAKADTPITLTFPRIGNPWIDAGVVGLHRVLNGHESYVKPVPEPIGKLPGSSNFPDVTSELRGNGLSLQGPPEQVQACLEKAYDRVIACYYNISSQKQTEDIQSYNFFFESATDSFHKFPK